jgi:hypothetical protein
VEAITGIKTAEQEGLALIFIAEMLFNFVRGGGKRDCDE